MESVSLATWAVWLGSLAVLTGILMAAAPAWVIRGLVAFPRSRLPAWILTAAGLFWVSQIVLNAHLGRFEHLKPLIYAAGPVSFLLMVFFMDELLAPRALGGLLLLVANPILNAARWHPSNWRLVMTVIAYLFVVAGIVFMLGPYRFRQVAALITASEKRCRTLGALRIVAGLLILYLGFRVY